MNRLFEFGFWLDLGHRISGIFGNMFRWTFGSKRRLMTVMFCIIGLMIFWGFGKLESARQAAIAAPVSTPTASATAQPCTAPEADTNAEKSAAALAVRICTSANYNDPRRSATTRALTVAQGTATEAAPEPAVVERFAFNVPNRVEQIGGADAQGIVTVLATSSKSQFLMGFTETGSLASIRDITEIADATPTVTPTPSATNGTQSATSSAPAPTPTMTGKK